MKEGMGGDSYQPTAVRALRTILRLNHGLQRRHVNVLGRDVHDARALGQHVAAAVQPREVQAYQQRGSLGLGDLVREEVGDCAGDLLRGEGGPAGPELLEEGLNVDGREGGRRGCCCFGIRRGVRCRRGHCSGVVCLFGGRAGFELFWQERTVCEGNWKGMSPLMSAAAV